MVGCVHATHAACAETVGSTALKVWKSGTILWPLTPPASLIVDEGLVARLLVADIEVVSELACLTNIDNPDSQSDRAIRGARGTPARMSPRHCSPGGRSAV